MNVVTARQAIVNKKNQTVGYELLFRDGESNSFPDIEPHEATGKLINQTHLNFGLNEITGGRRAFINFTEKCLIAGYPMLMSSKDIVVEVLETVPPSDEIYAAVKALFHKGYIVALDDFVYSKEWLRFLPFVKIIKIDISQTPLDSIAPFITKLEAYKARANRKNKIHLLAERVETNAEFMEAKRMGFDYFQGYFFCRPEIHRSKDIGMSQVTLAGLYQELCSRELNITRIAAHFRSDEALTYKLLVFMNSGIFNVTKPISDVKHALSYMGEENVRKFISLLTTTELAKNKPREVLRVGTVRAATCEKAAKVVLPAQSQEAFMVGLLSILPSVLDRTMESLLSFLKVTDGIKDALLADENGDQTAKKGMLYAILNATKNVERGAWHDTNKSCQAINIDYDRFCGIYSEAIKFSQEYESAVSHAA
jgi:EAL and modified HD-GYP domain-containing signal transduction protein